MNLAVAFAHKVGKGISEVDAATVLEFAGLDPQSNWNPNDQSLKCLFYDALLGYIDQDNVGIKSESEGGYSKTYDHSTKGDYLYRLAQESGCTDLIDKYNPNPMITDRSNLW